MMFKEFVREVNREENAISNAKAKEEGISIGVEQRNLELAKQMLLEHESLDKIEKYTSLSKEVIQNLMK